MTGPGIAALFAATLASLPVPGNRPLLDSQRPVVTPIGPGAAYRPGAGHAAAACAGKARALVHVELFANRRAIVIPAGIGTCTDPLRTRTPTGIVELMRTRLTVGDLFRIWGRPLGEHRLLSFRSGSALRAYVNGHTASSPTAIRLTPGAEIVLELGGYVPPHVSFLFPRSLS